MRVTTTRLNFLTMTMRRFLTVLFVIAFAAACGGGGGGSGGTTGGTGGGGGGGGSGGGGDPQPAPVSKPEAARFLSQATFGPTSAEIDAVSDGGLEDWLLAEFDKPPTLHNDWVVSQFPNGQYLTPDGNVIPGLANLPTQSFWAAAIEGDDQLRQRMAFALSQIFVISQNDPELLLVPQTTSGYMDVLTENAFGNYRDLIEDITYSPAMADYLTYLYNARGDMATGRVPDENYAREIMQLFSIGLVELNLDGTPRLDGAGEPIETYDNEDVTGLAKVFTGLGLAGVGLDFSNIPTEAFYQRLEMIPALHSNLEKSFLTTTIPPNTDGDESISIALDALYNHPNTAPFISRQLIQRFVTSSPAPDYVARVATAFESGLYELPDSRSVGTGVRGDLQATIAAVLFDEDARNDTSLDNDEFGKLREPILRFTHWARAFKVNSADSSNEPLLFDASNPAYLAQHPYRAPSVFNFYRPGYILPGSETGNAGLTAPEFQIVNASTIVGYANYLTAFIVGETPKARPGLPAAFQPDYSVELPLAETPSELVDHLDLLLSNGAMQDETRTRIIDSISQIPIDDADRAAGQRIRTVVAIIMVMTSPDYIVQR